MCLIYKQTLLNHYNMKLRHFICPALAAVLMLASCNKDNNTPGDDNSETYKETNTDELSKALVCAKVMPPETELNYSSDEEYTASREALRIRRNKTAMFCMKFAEKVGFSTEKNTINSPISAFLVLGMAAESANGDTQKELLDALGMTMDELKAMSHDLSNELNRSLNPDFTYDWETGDRVELAPKNLIKSINTIWTCDKVHFNQEGLANVSKDFYCDLFSTDFLSGEGNKLINAYVKNETRGFLDIDLNVDPETVLALMNVLYVKEVWNDNSRDLDDTDKQYEFENSDKSVVKQKLLQGYYASGRAIKGSNYRKFYTCTNDGFRLTFIVPENGSQISDIYNYETLINRGYTTEERNGNVVTRYHTRCMFPEFKADVLQSVKDAIKELGVKHLFMDGGCDFSNLVDYVDGASGIYCSDVKQAARLEVSRSGIEGAAVTIMEMTMESSPGHDETIYKDVYEDFIVDKAFAYTLEDPYGNILFTGIVNSIK